MRTIVILIALFVTGCGNFPLSGPIHGPGKSQDQMQSDVLFCKDQAHMAANTAERQAGNFLLGMTIIGTPLAFELEKKKQREVFASCMNGKGYNVSPVPDEQL